MKNVKIIVFLFTLISSDLLIAQNTPQYSDKYLKKHPVWIEMMEQPNVNFFEAEKAFDLFWEGKDKPVEEEEVLGGKFAAREKRKEGFAKNLFRFREDAAEKYAFQYKKFEHWEMQVRPFVQADGRILTQEERLKIWEQEKKRPQVGK